MLVVTFHTMDTFERINRWTERASHRGQTPTSPLTTTREPPRSCREPLASRSYVQSPRSVRLAEVECWGSEWDRFACKGAGPFITQTLAGRQTLGP
jgi:hypothetical protein